jgi:photosystem II stability/assembly factor-like uncharacterized protein
VKARERVGTADLSSDSDPNSISFWNGRRGIVGTGDLFASRPEGRVLLTRDGGRSFKTVREHRRAIAWVDVAPGGHAWALAAEKRYRDPRLLHSPDGGRSWRRVSQEKAYAPTFATARDGLAITGPKVFSGNPFARKQLLLTSDGGRTWQVAASPCAPSFFASPSFPAVGSAWAMCSNEGVGRQQRTFYFSPDGGRSWQPRGTDQGAIAYSVNFSAAGFGLLIHTDTPKLTRNGGETWKRARLPSFGSDGVSLLSATRGFALSSGEIFFTKDAGRNWHKRS